MVVLFSTSSQHSIMEPWLKAPFRTRRARVLGEFQHGYPVLHLFAAYEDGILTQSAFEKERSGKGEKVPARVTLL